MNGDSIVERETGEAIEGLDKREGVKSCLAHHAVVTAGKLSLRMAERAMTMHKWTLALLVSVLISIWIKGGTTQIVERIMEVVVKSVIAGVP